LMIECEDVRLLRKMLNDNFTLQIG